MIKTQHCKCSVADYLNRLTEIGVLEKKVIEGSHYYLNLELYRILSE